MKKTLFFMAILVIFRKEVFNLIVYFYDQRVPIDVIFAVILILTFGKILISRIGSKDGQFVRLERWNPFPTIPDGCGFAQPNLGTDRFEKK